MTFGEGDKTASRDDAQNSEQERCAAATSEKKRGSTLCLAAQIASESTRDLPSAAHALIIADDKDKEPIRRLYSTAIQWRTFAEPYRHRRRPHAPCQTLFCFRLAAHCLPLPSPCPSLLQQSTLTRPSLIRPTRRLRPRLAWPNALCRSSKSIARRLSSFGQSAISSTRESQRLDRATLSAQFVPVHSRRLLVFAGRISFALRL